MRIALLIDCLTSGGAQRQLLLLAEELKARGHEVAVCVYMPGRFYARELDLARIELVEFHPRTRWKKFTMVYSWLRKWRPQIVQAFLGGANAIAELSSLLPRTWKIVVSERMAGTPLGRAARHLHRRANWVTTNSYTNMEELLVAAPELGANSSVIWNMVDLEDFAPPAAPRARATDDVVRLLCVASMCPRKNARRLVEALHLLDRRNVHNVQLRWVGKRRENASHGEAYGETLDLVKRYGLERHFTFAGETENVLEEYHAADALVLVSFNEGVPNVVCEAMACGLPLVLSDVSDHPRIIGGRRMGFLCSPDDPTSIANALHSMTRLSENERRAMGQSARKSAEEMFHRNRFVGDYEAIYRHLLGETTGAAPVTATQTIARL